MQHTDLVDVTVVLVNYNTGHLLDEQLRTLAAAVGSLRVQTIVVDNASRDDSLEVLKKYPHLEVIANPANIGFARANNQALPRMRGRHLLLLNTDAFVSPDTLLKTVGYMDANPGCGVLGVRLVGGDGSLQPSCRYFPTPWNVFLASTGLSRYFPRSRLIDDMSWDHNSVRECDWVPGCYYLVRREVIERVGLFDPRYFMYYEEVDHCRAVRRAGWRVVYFPHTGVVHLGGMSAETEATLNSARQISKYEIESELLYFRKHYGVLGMLAGVALSLLADALRVCSGLVRLRVAGTVVAIHRSDAMLRLLAATRLASRPTQ